MKNKTNTTRLGRILLDKGLVTALQLDAAIREQNFRRENKNSTQQITALGEILIELGFIDRVQLKRSLGWQLLLRRLGIAMAFCAPLMSLGSSAAASSLSASSSSSRVLPVTVQAENYSSMLGIQTETTADVGGGLDVGYIHAGDWMSYSGTSINIPAAGSYKIIFRVASPGGGGSFNISEASNGTVYDTISVPSTGGSQIWVNVERTITLAEGVHSFNITALVRGTGFNINWFKIEALGTPLPVVIQAESFASMSGIQTQATTDVEGGLNVGYMDSGDWLSYSNTVINLAGTDDYKITYRLASTSGGGSFTLNEASTGFVYDTVPVPATGSTQAWRSIERIVTLPLGAHSFKIVVVARGSGININWFKIDRASSLSSAASSSSRLASSASTSASTPLSQTTSSTRASSSPSLSPSSAWAASSNIANATSSVQNRSSQMASTSSIRSSSLASSIQASSFRALSSRASSSSATVAGPVSLSWLAPTQRENLTPLDINELGGYEIRYKLANDVDFTYITINDAWTTYYYFAWLDGAYTFQVAAFDKNNLYSNYVNLTPH